MITEGYVVRHYQGRSGGRGSALIDIAQDHLLLRLADRGLFDLGISLKGGMAMRRIWAGSAGRFSTDLDFAGLDDAAAELVLEAVDGAHVGPFGFTTRPIDGTLRVAVLITSPFGSPEVPARLDPGRRPPWLAARPAQHVAMPIHQRYDFTMPPVLAARVEEIVAEKLARFRRASLARDRYDLAWFATRPFDEVLVRRLTALKVWCDVVDDGLGSRRCGGASGSSGISTISSGGLHSAAAPMRGTCGRQSRLSAAVRRARLRDRHAPLQQLQLAERGQISCGASAVSASGWTRGEPGSRRLREPLSLQKVPLFVSFRKRNGRFSRESA